LHPVSKSAQPAATAARIAIAAKKRRRAIVVRTVCIVVSCSRVNRE
jgi:hypothetical protein